MGAGSSIGQYEGPLVAQVAGRPKLSEQLRAREAALGEQLERLRRVRQALDNMPQLQALFDDLDGLGKMNW